MNASILKIAPIALTVEGTVKEWENWTGMKFPASGQYIVRGALEPVEFENKKTIG